MADYFVSEELQDYLVTALPAQLPGATPSLAVPSVWLQPRDGAPVPRRSTAGGFAENATITLAETMVAGPAPTDAWLETTVVDVTVRATANQACKLLQRQIRDLIAPRGDYMGRKLWTMSDLLVERSWVWKPDQALAADEDSYTRVQSFMFECRRKSLAGLTLP